MDLLDAVRVLRRRWRLVAAAPAVALLVALAITLPSIHSAESAPETYEATHLLYHADPQGAAVPLGTVALLADRGEIPQRVVERLEGSDARQVAADVEIEANDELRLITVSATLTDPERAERVVDLYAEEILAYFEDDQADAAALQQSLNQQEEQLVELDERLADLGAGSATAAELRDQRDALLERIGRTRERLSQLRESGLPVLGLRTLQPGTATVADPDGFQPPTTPGPRLLLATAMGLLLGIALAFVVDRLDTRIRSRKEAETAFGLPVVAEIPKTSRRRQRGRSVVTTTDPSSMAAEGYRRLRLAQQVMSRWMLRTSVEPGSLGQMIAHPVEGSVPGNRGLVVLVTSPGPGDGKTTTVANLAASFAEVDKTVLLLDCDFRSPQLATAMKVAPDVGVADYLRRGSQSTHLANVAKPTFIPNVWLVPSGKAVGNPGELLNPDTDLVTTAAELADVVLIDVGPLLAVNEAATLARLVDAVVLVARAGRTTIDAANRSAEQLARVEAPISGVALLGLSDAELGDHYYGRYGRYGATPTVNGNGHGHPPRVFPPQPKVLR